MDRRAFAYKIKRGSDMKLDPDEVEKEYGYLDGLDFYGLAWEFIRRNKEYQELYLKFRGEYDYWCELIYKPPMLEGENYEEWADRTRGIALNRYDDEGLFWPLGLRYGLHPALKANGNIDETLREIIPLEEEAMADTVYSLIKFGLKHYFHHKKDAVFYNLHRTLGFPDEYVNYLEVAEILKDDWTREHPEAIEVLIDTTKSIPKIQEEIIRLVEDIRRDKDFDVQREAAMDGGEFTKKDKNRRARTNEWPNYLIVFDLNKKGIRRGEIAKILFPTEDNSYPYRASQKVDKYVSKATELIKNMPVMLK